jgi:chromosome segregation ATPase
MNKRYAHINELPKPDDLSYLRFCFFTFFFITLVILSLLFFKLQKEITLLQEQKGFQEIQIELLKNQTRSLAARLDQMKQSISTQSLYANTIAVQNLQADSIQSDIIQANSTTFGILCNFF